jgi:glycosyltransferase involved in cell wall biosynthesis
MRASVVIATANRATLLPGLLACLEAQSVLDFEVVIVDDGSRDET